MTKLFDLFDPGLLASMEDAGYVRRGHHERLPLLIFNYTQRAQYGAVWNDVTEQCRGLIVDETTGEVIARPFRKFFNLGEHDPKDPRLAGPYTVSEKLDGSLGIVYTYDGETAVATRGSFHSEQATWATEWYRERFSGPLDPEGVTTLVEIVYPANRIVLDYGERAELVHLASLDTATALPMIVGFGAASFLTAAKKYDPENLTPSDVRQLDPTGEGFVLHFHEHDLRVKVKHDEYVRLHRLLTSTSTRTVWESLRAREDPSLIAENVPDEFHAWLRETVASLQGAHSESVSEAHAQFQRIHTTTADRKTFAEQAKKSDLSGLLFMLYDGRDINDAAWKRLKPTHSVPYVDDGPE